MAYCAYCKTHIFDETRKCPNCGSTMFITENRPSAVQAAKAAQEAAEAAASAAAAAAARPQVVYVERPAEKTVYVDRPVVVQPSVSEKSWIATLLLCLLFGGLGIHRFYVGKAGTGILFLLTGGFVGIGWLVDFISILCCGFSDKQGLRIRP
jgi:TM2 domain-containing membrane protein YozV